MFFLFAGHPAWQTMVDRLRFQGDAQIPEDKDTVQTALRETEEEIGLKPNAVNVLGRINELLTITNYRVTPYVGVIPWPYPFRRAEFEVARIFSIPLEWLVDPNHHEERQRILPEPYPPINVTYFEPYDHEILWGVSARFILDLIDHLMCI